MATTSMVQKVEFVGTILGRCRGLKVVKSCSYSLVDTFLLYDVSFSHSAQCHRQQTDGQMTVSRQQPILLCAIRSAKTEIVNLLTKFS